MGYITPYRTFFWSYRALPTTIPDEKCVAFVRIWCFAVDGAVARSPPRVKPFAGPDMSRSPTFDWGNCPPLPPGTFGAIPDVLRSWESIPIHPFDPRTTDLADQNFPRPLVLSLLLPLSFIDYLARPSPSPSPLVVGIHFPLPHRLIRSRSCQLSRLESSFPSIQHLHFLSWTPNPRCVPPSFPLCSHKHADPAGRNPDLAIRRPVTSSTSPGIPTSYPSPHSILPISLSSDDVFGPPGHTCGPISSDPGLVSSRTGSRFPRELSTSQRPLFAFSVYSRTRANDLDICPFTGQREGRPLNPFPLPDSSVTTSVFQVTRFPDSLPVPHFHRRLRVPSPRVQPHFLADGIFCDSRYRWPHPIDIDYRSSRVISQPVST